MVKFSLYIDNFRLLKSYYIKYNLLKSNKIEIPRWLIINYPSKQ
jgi:hypothetical protein